MPGTDLRRAIDDTAGANMACLVTTVMRLRLVHLDDSVGEGPHSAATRIGAASRAPTWGWIASAMRMKQNLVEFVSATDEAHLSRQQLWNKYKSVLHRRQQSRVRGQRNFREAGNKRKSSQEAQSDKRFSQRINKVLGNNEPLFRFSNLENLMKSLLEEQKDEMSAEAKSEVRKQDCRADFLDSSVRDLQRQLDSNRLEIC